MNNNRSSVTDDRISYMIPHNDFNGAHKWNLGGSGREKAERERELRSDLLQWCECASIESEAQRLYRKKEIKEASGSYSFRRLETVWGVHFRAALSSKLKQAFLEKNCVHRVPFDVNRMFN